MTITILGRPDSIPSAISVHPVPGGSNQSSAGEVNEPPTCLAGLAAFFFPPHTLA